MAAVWAALVTGVTAVAVAAVTMFAQARSAQRQREHDAAQRAAERKAAAYAEALAAIAVAAGLIAEIAAVKNGGWSPLDEEALGEQLHDADMEIRRAREAIRLSADREALTLFEAMWKPARDLRKMLVAGHGPADQNWLDLHERLDSARQQFAATLVPRAVERL
ncbi:hypothetical protein [Blastococcus sp. VKM Ac-2987]|uniref:hypothetical protein n=1 Tax=Blastococcus sp. VKM Ac-2987 TaxID=3004141 RepID=UPI0022ABA612|nr:hypothetical protein [Blastococcus sp. VKM Ac-2987]MCZ2860712.1 hypothetical protein [Blastococcus sp. VKM Ac-2987]